MRKVTLYLWGWRGAVVTALLMATSLGSNVGSSAANGSARHVGTV